MLLSTSRPQMLHLVENLSVDKKPSQAPPPKKIRTFKAAVGAVSSGQKPAKPKEER